MQTTEPRSRTLAARFELWVEPSLKEKAKEYSKNNNISLAELVRSLLKEKLAN
jgi:predicted HicB family RNase H-like nuclease